MNAPLHAATNPCRTLLALLLILASGLPLPGGAAHRGSPPLVQLDIVDRDSGKRLHPYRHRGQDWIPGEPGHRYAVRLRNRSGARILAVLSVDGINAIDGRTADPRQAGYVLGPWQTLEITGWRKSLGTVAQFVFDDPARSYAARTGRPDNIGVIGVAVFCEKVVVRRYPSIGMTSPAETSRSDGRVPAGSAAAPSTDAVRQESRAAHAHGEPYPASSLGTGHGAIEGSQAYYTGFERQAAPSQVSELRYDTRAGLLARGIPVDPPPGSDAFPPARRPRAFPGNFAPDPG